MATHSGTRTRTRIQLLLVVGLTTLTVVGCSSGGSPGPAAEAATTSRASTTTSAASSDTTQHSIDVDGNPRTWLTHVPAHLDRSKPVPLVVMLHGGFGSAAHTEAVYGWDAKADAEGFVVVYPDGAGRAWNAGTCCGTPARTKVDDVGFIAQVVERTRADLNIDPRRIFAAGMSNGAMMAERLACETKVFAAIASVAGAQMVPCTDPQPTSVLHIHGTADTNVPMDGSPGDGIGKVPSHPPIADTIAAWRTVDDCGDASTQTSEPVTTSTATCPDRRAVELVTITGGGHQWPTVSGSRVAGKSQLTAAGFNGTDRIWEFFAGHPAPA